MNKILLTSGLCLAMAPAFAQRPAPSRPKSAPETAKPSDAMNAPTRVAGRVTFPNARPAAGALVYLRWVTGGNGIKTLKLEADAQGAFSGSISLAPKLRGQMIQVTALLPGKNIVCQQASVTGGKMEKLNLRLTPGVTLTGRLIRTDGKPAANVAVSVASLSSPVPLAPGEENEANLSDNSAEDHLILDGRQSIRQMPITGIIAAQFHAQTDAAGLFTLTGLPIGGRITLQPGAGLLLASGSMSAINLPEGDHQDAGILVAVKSGRIKLHLVDKHTGKPVVNGPAELVFAQAALTTNQALENGGFASAATANAQGDVEFKNLRPGDYKILVEGGMGTAHLDEGATPPPHSDCLAAGSAARASFRLAGQAACQRRGDSVQWQSSSPDDGGLVRVFRGGRAAGH